MSWNFATKLRDANHDERAEIQAVLMELPSVADCAVVARATPDGEAWVAWVVPAGPFTQRAAEAHVRARAPRIRLPDCYALVTTLPKAADGTLDEGALSELPVIEEQAAADAESALLADPNVESAAVFLVEASRRIPPLHLADLFPGGARATDVVGPAPAVLSTPSATADHRRIDVTESRPPAVSSGAPLTRAEHAPQTLPELLARVAAESTAGGITYVRGDGTTREQSFAELLDEAQRICAGLLRSGLGRGQHVMLQLTESEDVLPAFWGCLLGGMIPAITAVPSSYDAQTNELDRLGQILQLLEGPPLLTTERGRSQMGSFVERLGLARDRVLTIERLRGASASPATSALAPDDVAFVTLTSGSTGTPKAIMLSHRNILARSDGTNRLCGHDRSDRILNWLPFDHIGSISDWHLRCVALGCHMVYASKEHVLADPLEWLRLIDRFRITHSWAPNFAYALINEALARTTERLDLGCVKALLTAGEAVSSATMHDFLRRTAPLGLPRTALRPAFGMAELGSGVTYYQPSEAAPVRIRHVDRAHLDGPLQAASPDDPRAIGFTSLGPVIPGAAMRIVDEHDNPLPEDTIGRLQIAGAPVCLGYHRNPDANRLAFVGDGWFDTGDRGFISSGELYLTGRDKETLVIRGAKYHNGEIEAAVDEADGVQVSFTAACAVRAADTTWSPQRGRPASGAPEERLAVFFSPEDSAAGPELVEILRRVQESVARKTGVRPDYLVPMAREAIPKTAIGKIQRKELIRRFEAGELDALVRGVDRLLENERTIPDWFLSPVWRPSALRPRAVSTRERSFVIIRDRRGFAEAIARELQALGATAVVADAAPGEGPRADIIDVTRHAPPAAVAARSATAAEVLVELITRVRERAASMSRPGEPPIAYLVVASHSQAASSGDVVDPVSASIPPVLRALSRELAGVRCRHVDVPFSTDRATLERDARRIALEAMNPSADDEIAYRGGERLVLRFRSIDWARSADRPAALEQGGFYLLTGGLGGVGVALARHLLTDWGARLLIIGRSAADAEKAAALRELQAAGVVTHRALDVCHADELQAAVREAETSFGAPLQGIFHLAGAYHELTAAQESAESLAAVLRPKLEGTIAVHALLDDRPGAFVVCFSSLAAVWSGNGISAYAAANRCLDALCHEERRRGRRSFNPSWAVWQDLGIGAATTPVELARAKGYHSITAPKGMCSLGAALGRGAGQLLIGVDPAHATIERFLDAPARPTMALRGGFVRRESRGAARATPSVSIRDRFGRWVPIELRPLPRGSDGQLDRREASDRLAGVGTRELAPPETETERKLVDIWKRVLGIESMGVRESFFELGGTSVLSVRMLAEVQRRIGPNLPPATLLRAATVRALAELIDRELGAEGGKTAFSPLVLIQNGRRGLPFFCVHGAEGNVLNLRELARGLGRDQTFYGLQAQGVDGAEPLHTVEDMAALYLPEILRVHPRGPFLLGGYSGGGVVAFEMAQRLRKAGHDVPLLVLLDTFSAGVTRRPAPIQDYLADLLDEGPGSLPRWAKEKVFGRLAALREGLRLRFHTSLSQPLPFDLRGPLLAQAFREAATRYRPEPYPGAVTLYRATRIALSLKHAGPKLGWDALAPRMTIVEIPGDHSSLVDEPNVSIMTSHLARALRAASEGHPDYLAPSTMGVVRHAT